MREVVIAGAVRTPIGKFGGALAGLTAAQLGAAAAAEALRRSGVPLHQIDEAVFGCARQAGGGPMMRAGFAGAFWPGKWRIMRRFPRESRPSR